MEYKYEKDKKKKLNIWIFFYCFLFKEFVGVCGSLSCNMNEMCKYKRYIEDKIVDCVFLGIFVNIVIC